MRVRSIIARLRLAVRVTESILAWRAIFGPAVTDGAVARGEASA